MSKSSSSSKVRTVNTPTTPKDASRIQGAVARSTGSVTADNYVARMQRAAAKNAGKTN